jgi:outer membrane receptor protein involved in Fe transport
MGKNTLQVAILSAILLTGGTLVRPQTAYAQDQAQAYSIEAGDLEGALSRFGTESHIQLIYPPELLKGKRSHGLTGSYAPADALRLLLDGSGLKAERVNDKTVVIKQASAATKEPQAANSTAPAAASPEPEVRNLGSMTVTGTRIRGGATPSPVITIGSERMQEEGFANLGEVIRSIPQNFSGGQNPGVTPAQGGTESNQNITGGSGLNLRGLGPDTTLTLLNGRRMSYGGFVQAVDISAIPIEAVERLEIVPDGASAIYGSDAVGGVANVILKRDFDGVTVGAHYGGATEGGLITRGYTATAGTTWATGGMILAGEKTSSDPIYSDQRDYTESMYRPTTLWQGNDLRSGLFSLHQSLGEAIELDLDAIRSQRGAYTDMAYASAYYPYKVETKTTLLAPSLEVRLPNDWTLTFSGTLGKEKNAVAQPVMSSADGSNISNYSVTYRNKSLAYEVGAEGPLFALPGGDARLAAGAGHRDSSLVSMSNNIVDTDGSQGSRFAYAELSLPLVGPGQDIAGIERLELTGAIRTEDGNYGRVTTPKFGVVYSPSTDFSLKSSWGKSFKAPTLSQRFYQNGINHFTADGWGTGYPADATVLFRFGGNVDLKPERAQTWSASLAFHPEALPGLDAELTWFDIDYVERVLAPINSTNVLGNPIYASFIEYDPTAAAQAEVIANTGNFSNYVGAPYDAGKVVAIIDGRYANISRQRIKGVDLSGAYRADLDAGQLTFRGSVSWLDSTQATTASGNPYDLAGTLFYPARINGRIGALWNQGGFTASLFGNYRSGVKNRADGRHGASFTTFDGTLLYETGDGAGALANMVFELSAQNLLNRAPPLYAATSLTFTPYDSTNYSPVGRYFRVSVSKHF